MKKNVLSTLLLCAFIIITSCDNETQENSIETISETKTIQLGDDLIELCLVLK